MKVNKSEQAMTSSIFKQLLPSSLCQQCRAPALSDFLCRDCRNELPYLAPTQCRGCALPLPESAELCPECLIDAPAFDSTLCCFQYQAPVSRWIHNFKYNGNLGQGRLLLKELLQSIEGAAAPLPELLMPVPMPRLRQWQRGFNQTQWLTGELSSALEIPVCQALKCNSNSQSQARQNRAMRLNNKRHSFTLQTKALQQIKNRHIALIDDVMTTGATLRAASKILKDSGACRVDLWIIARTAKEHGK